MQRIIHCTRVIPIRALIYAFQINNRRECTQPNDIEGETCSRVAERNGTGQRVCTHSEKWSVIESRSKQKQMSSSYAYCLHIYLRNTKKEKSHYIRLRWAWRNKSPNKSICWKNDGIMSFSIAIKRTTTIAEAKQCAWKCAINMKVNSLTAFNQASCIRCRAPCTTYDMAWFDGIFAHQVVKSFLSIIMGIVVRCTFFLFDARAWAIHTFNALNLN